MAALPPVGIHQGVRNTPLFEETGPCKLLQGEADKIPPFIEAWEATNQKYEHEEVNLDITKDFWLHIENYIQFRSIRDRLEEAAKLYDKIIIYPLLPLDADTQKALQNMGLDVYERLRTQQDRFVAMRKKVHELYDRFFDRLKAWRTKGEPLAKKHCLFLKKTNAPYANESTPGWSLANTPYFTAAVDLRKTWPAKNKVDKGPDEMKEGDPKPLHPRKDQPTFDETDGVLWQGEADKIPPLVKQANEITQKYEKNVTQEITKDLWTNVDQYIPFRSARDRFFAATELYKKVTLSKFPILDANTQKIIQDMGLEEYEQLQADQEAFVSMQKKVEKLYELFTERLTEWRTAVEPMAKKRYYFVKNELGKNPGKTAPGYLMLGNSYKMSYSPYFSTAVEYRIATPVKKDLPEEGKEKPPHPAYKPPHPPKYVPGEATIPETPPVDTYRIND